MESDLNIQPGTQSFGGLLRAFRIGAQLTQEELAERSGVSVRAISDLEREVKTRPQRATVDLLSRGLDLDDDRRAVLDAAIPGRHRFPARHPRALDLPVGGFLGSVPERRMVARTQEIERIRGTVSTVTSGAGRLLLLAGEPGAGKTRLAQEVTLICRANGMLMTAGQCYEPSRTVAYFPFLAILSRLVTVARSRFGFDPLRRWPQLQPLIPAEPLGAASDASLVAGEGDQQRLFWAVSGLLEHLSTLVPIVLAVDDLHWADQSSLALFLHLAHQLRQVPVLLLGTYRDVDIGPRHPLRQVLRDLQREQLSEEIRVGPLTSEETGALMLEILGGGVVASSFVEVVQRITSGNPFFVGEEVRALLERGDAFERDGVWDCRPHEEVAIPRSVQDAIGERLAHLDDRTQAILSAASVFGDTFEFDELQIVSDASEAEIEEALDRAVRASLIGFGQGDRYAFHHALIQQVLYRRIPPRRRKRLHFAAGEAIEQLPEGPRFQRASELADHFRRAGVSDRALTYAAIAGDQAESRFAYQEAGNLYRDSLELAREIGDAQTEAVILGKLGRVLTNVGQYEDAGRMLEQSLPLFRLSDDRRGEIRATVQLGSTYRAMGRSSDAADLVRELLDRIELNAMPEDVAELYIVLETLFYAIGRYRDGLRAAERGVQIARGIDDVVVLGRALTGLGTELFELGRMDEGFSALEEAIALPHAADDPFNLVRALDNVSYGYQLRGNLIRSRDLAQQTMEVAERIQSPWDTAIALVGMGACYRLLGEWQLAGEYLGRGLQLQQALPAAWWSIYVMQELGAMCLDQGELERASSLLQDGLSIALAADHLSGLRTIEGVLAELDLLEGRPEQARSRLEPLLDRAGLEELQVTKLLPTLASAYDDLGDFERAEQTIDEAVRRSRAVDARLLLAEALIVRGRLRGARRLWESAEEDFGQAVDLARTMPNPHLEGRALFEWGRMAASKRDDDLAQQRLAAALAIFERLGAAHYVERARQGLAPAETP